MRCDRCGEINEAAARFCGTCGAELAITLVGRVLGSRYRVLSFIGSGGMGRVYRAEHTLLERPVAIKVLAPEYATDELMWDRFRREALAAGRIAHPHIAATLDFGYEALEGTERLLYSVMEYVDGTPLDALEMPLDVPRAIGIARQVAQALGAAHDAGVIHRDIKPGNIIVCELGGQDFIKIVDFGLAVLRTGRKRRRSTSPGFTMGTPAYVSPEQVLGDEIDARADVYSLGSVFYEMLVGQPPFGYGDAARLSVSHAYQIPPRPSEFVHILDMPEDVEEFLMCMLSKNPNDRPPDGRAVATALARLHDQISSVVSLLTRVEAAIVVVRFDDIDNVGQDMQRQVIEIIGGMGGKIARTAGDELISYFESSTAAAVAAAARLSAFPGAIQPAVAVHQGMVEIGASGGLFGSAVNTALRMARLAAPGEALASEEVREILDHTLQDCLVEGGKLRLGDRTRSSPVYRVTGFTKDTHTTHPPVAIGEVRGKSTVSFTCSCGYQGVIVAGKLHADKAIRIRCASCARQLSVVPILVSPAASRDSSPSIDHDPLDHKSTDKMPEIRDQLIVDQPPGSDTE
jgi:hypothetical protein